jgi:DNA polymerase III subunit epsilon
MSIARTAIATSYAAADLPSPDTPWRNGRYCVVDLETTGLSPRRHEIVSFAAVPIDDGRIRPGAMCESIVKPMRPLRVESIRIHGIRPADVAGAPPLSRVMDDLLEALTGRILVVHVDWVERGFLSTALRDRGMRLREPILDTALLARRVFRQLPGTTPLPALARRLRLPIYTQHEARGDALTTAQVFLALASRLERLGAHTVGDLCEAGASSRPRSALRALLGR